VRRLLLSIPVLLAATPTLAAPQDPPLRLQVEPASGAVHAFLGEVADAPGIRRSLESGLPVRIRIVTELWRERLFDAQEGRHEWRATIRLDPITERYRVETAGGAQGEVFSATAARAFLQARMSVPLRPTRPGRYYYLARIEIETLSLSDLDELRRWLQGDLGPAIEGREEVGGAIGRGLRRLMVRALRLPVQRYRTRTPTFDFAG
jgi:hypothetical protein